MTRFDVMTVSGFATERRGSTNDAPGLSAHVIDRAFNCKVVATYRSEERLLTGYVGSGRPTLGTVGAVLAAKKLARHLEALYG